MSSAIKIIIAYVNRYFRIVSLLILIILIANNILPKLADGPIGFTFNDFNWKWTKSNLVYAFLFI